MLFGVGIDIVRVERIKTLLDKKNFLTRCFSASEIEYFKTKKNPAQSVAASFAAKEAFSKSLGSGFCGFFLKDIEVLHDSKGKPYLKLTEAAKKIADELLISSFSVSLAHESDCATAVVVAERK